ncbi:hypothetical protein AUR64_03940 [Haloprofundus marisrubri]|uniref:Protein NO VEIN C-terminal domain-containing protein n=1 Tax=Haloprofundus marisrubri TaxID=1514971 RepID=A0A0W1RDA3_9EURY|nr:hypothetical protein [Haloprofundus marisrubri]KTG11415.1 hypothetical protein AUR64_03940 [Haloprofundus marisrubri]
MDVTDPDSIADIQSLHLGTYQSNPDRIESDAGTERQDRADYEGRFIFELLQNAVDEMDDTEDPRVKLELTEDALLVANNGNAFSIKDLYALTLTTRTTKAGETTIGHKGRGFTSVLGITDNPRVYSNEITGAQFDREATADLLNEDDTIVNRLDREVEDSQVPLLGVPHSTDQPTRVSELLDEGYTTVFELPLREPSRHRGSITRKLQALEANTVALLPQLKQIKIVSPEWERMWEITRTDIDGNENQLLVELDCETTTEGTTESVTRQFCFFNRSDIDQDCIAEQADLTEPEIDAMGELSVGVVLAADPVRENPDPVVADWELAPVYGESSDRPPYIHVFLPTKERSPIPALVTGTFQSDTSRRNLTLDYDDEQGYQAQFNALLFAEVGALLEETVIPFVTESATETASFLDALDPSLGQKREWSFTPGSVDHCLFSEIISHISSVEFLPSAFDDHCVAIDDVCVPPTSAKIPELGERFVGLLASATEAPNDLPQIPAGSLLGHNRVQTLAAYGASELTAADIPEVLERAGADPEFRKTRESEWGLFDEERSEDDEECILHIDPVLEYFVQLRKTLESDEEREGFDTTCRSHSVLPIGVTVSENGRLRALRKGNDDDSVFMPPEEDMPEGTLPALEFLPRELYYGTNASRAQKLRNKALPTDFTADLQTIWDINDYQFATVFDVGVRPSIPGPNTPKRDPSPLENMAALKTIQRMAAVHSPENDRSPDSSLLYKSSRRPFTDLTKLPLPTKSSDEDTDVEWYPAHRVYFSSAWQSALSRPDNTQIEPFLRTVSEETDSERFAPKFLASPEHLGVKIEDDDGNPTKELIQWVDFFKWLGVSEHIRPLPLFAPDSGTRHRYKKTKGLSRPPRSAISTPVDLSQPDHGKSPVDHRYTGLSEQEWEKYRGHLKEYIDREIPDVEQQYLFQINSLEYAAEILSAAKDEVVGERLLHHLVFWWGRGLSQHRHATVAEFTNSRWRGSNRNYVFHSGELNSLGQNLWIWQLRQSPWVPTTFGAVKPTAAWSLPAKDQKRFSLQLDRNYSLLPFLKGTFPTRLLHSSPDAEPLAQAFGIGMQLEQDSFSPTDAYHVLDCIGQLLTEKSVELAELSGAVELLYTRVAELLPGLQRGEITAEEWLPEASKLDTVLLLCRVGDRYELHPANETYFVRSRSSRDRYGTLGVPVISLFKSEAASFGTHCGATDLRAVVEKEPGYADGSTPPLSVADFTITDEWLETVLTALLLRLRTNRPSSALVDQDTSNTESFLEELVFVEDLDIEISLNDGSWGRNLEPEPQPYYIERDDNGNREILIDRTLDQTDFVAALTSAYTDRLNVPQYYEAVSNLVEHAFGNESPQTELQNRLRIVGSEVPDGQIASTRESLFSDEDDQPSPDDDEDHDDGWYSTDESGPSSNEEQEETETLTSTGSTPNRSGSAAHSRQVPDPSAVTKIGDREVYYQDSEPANDSNEEQSNSQNSGGQPARTNGGSGTAVAPSQEYRDKIDVFGMAITMESELNRLRQDGEENPAAKVIDVHTPQTYKEARDSSPILNAAIQNFGDQNGLEENPLKTDWPGFDVLTLKTDEAGQSVIDRCIELKTSGVNTQKPSLSWNEWKAAGGPLSEHYYLYVARNIRSGNSGDAKLLEIPQPFHRLRNRTREKRERNVQVDLRSFDFTDEPIIEQKIEWDE